MVGQWVYWTLIPLSLSPFGYIIWQNIYRRYIRPALFYKLVVLDQTEEYTFFFRKTKALIVQDKKGFVLFENKKNVGELYLVSTEDETLPSKRDDTGTTTFYYWRNNCSPIRFKDGKKIEVTGKLDDKKIISGINIPIDVKVKDQIETDNDASVLFKVYHTNMLNNALMEEPKQGINKGLTIGIGIIILVVTLALVFKDQIIGLFGG